MKKILIILLVVQLFGMAVVAEGVAAFSDGNSARMELEIEFATEADGAAEAAQFLTGLQQSAITAEITLQKINGGRILRADAVFHTKLFSQKPETIECWYEIDCTAETPHITVIEKNQNKDTYYELDVHKLPGGIEAAKAFNNALKAVWNQQMAENEELQKIQVPSERVAELVAAWINVSQPGGGKRSAADFGGALLSVDWSNNEAVCQINAQLELSARQTALLLGIQNQTVGESRVRIHAKMKRYETYGSETVTIPQIPPEQMTDANLLIDRKLFDSNSVTVLYNGNILQFDAQPRLENGTTMVPIRGIMEAAGVLPEQIAFNGARGTVTIQDGTKTILLTLGSKTAFVDGKEVQLSCAAYETEGRTFVPLRFVSEELGFQVVWTGLEQPNGICNGGVVRLER